jgi:hypothetical protein
MTITNITQITDGYHNHIEMASNGQLFVGARNCTAACLSIFNTGSKSVVLGTDTGDVTGVQPIKDRSVVYVCENGVLRIYDTTSDNPQAKQVRILGQAIDVKEVD